MTTLSEHSPHLAMEWHPSKNDKLTPNDVTSMSNKAVWWQCEKGHEWKSRVYSRSGKQSRGCPFCSNRKILIGYNDVATTHPNIVRYWSPNNHTTPNDLTAGSGVQVSWQCSEGHDRRTSVKDFIRYGCPTCAGNTTVQGYNDLLTVNPELALEVSPDSTIKADEVSQFSHTKLLWRCTKGHEWVSTVANRSKGSGCRYCREPKTSATEKSLASALRVFTDAVEGFVVSRWGNGTPMGVDIYLPERNTVIEYDGSYWHRSSKSHERDLRKTHHLLELGYRVIRVRENELPFLETEDDSLIQIRFYWNRKVSYDSLVAEILS